MVSVSRDHASEAELEHATDNMKQYALKHGHAFYLQHAETNKVTHFFSARWLSLLSNPLWERHEWVLHLDGDSIFVDFQKGLERFTSLTQDIFLQIRSNMEVTAAAVLLRTSPFSDCFLRLWASKGLHARKNSDNGDLLTVLLEFAAPDLAEKCEALRDPDYDEYRACFSQAHARLLLLADYMPIKVLPPLAGFQKSLEGLENPGLQADLPDVFKFHNRCWSTDIIGHGSKTIGTWAWSARKDLADVVPNCLYNTPDEELDLARRCCLWHYPGARFITPRYGEPPMA